MKNGNTYQPISVGIDGKYPFKMTLVEMELTCCILKLRKVDLKNKIKNEPKEEYIDELEELTQLIKRIDSVLRGRADKELEW